MKSFSFKTTEWIKWWTRRANELAGTGVMTAGGAIGAAIGSAAGGAAIGSIIPGPGTAIGGIIGAVGGFFINGIVSDAVGKLSDDYFGTNLRFIG